MPSNRTGNETPSGGAAGIAVLVPDADRPVETDRRDPTAVADQVDPLDRRAMLVRSDQGPVRTEVVAPGYRPEAMTIRPPSGVKLRTAPGGACPCCRAIITHGPARPAGMISLPLATDLTRRNRALALPAPIRNHLLAPGCQLEQGDCENVQPGETAIPSSRVQNDRSLF